MVATKCRCGHGIASDDETKEYGLCIECYEGFAELAVAMMFKHCKDPGDAVCNDYLGECIQALHDIRIANDGRSDAVELIAKQALGKARP